jgi:hypothetical protein
MDADQGLRAFTQEDQPAKMVNVPVGNQDMGQVFDADVPPGRGSGLSKPGFQMGIGLAEARPGVYQYNGIIHQDQVGIRP